MKKRQLYTVIGLATGAFFGISTGVAVGGTAYNGVLIFGALGALIGWLFGGGGQSSKEVGKEPSPDTPLDAADSVSSKGGQNDGRPMRDDNLIGASLRMFAGVWNFQIDMLDYIGILPLFQRNPWLFIVLGIGVSLVFPPFLFVYMVCFACAAECGLSPENGYRAKID